LDFAQWFNVICADRSAVAADADTALARGGETDFGPRGAAALRRALIKMKSREDAKDAKTAAKEKLKIKEGRLIALSAFSSRLPSRSLSSCQNKKMRRLCYMDKSLK
jgi:hypothetical protein